MEIDFETIGAMALGGLLVLTVVLALVLFGVRDLWRWARAHLATFDQIQASAKGGKIQLGATLDDRRTQAPAQVITSPDGVEWTSRNVERREPAS